MLIGFNEPMARRIAAGSDLTLMPSRFDPCDLTQMQAQRYGALPTAHATGGLADTIDDGTTGFLSCDGLMEACHRAFDGGGQLADMRRATMARSFSRAAAAAQCEAPYRRLTGRPCARAPRAFARLEPKRLPWRRTLWKTPTDRNNESLRNPTSFTLAGLKGDALEHFIIISA